MFNRHRMFKCKSKNNCFRMQPNVYKQIHKGSGIADKLKTVIYEKDSMLEPIKEPIKPIKKKKIIQPIKPSKPKINKKLLTNIFQTAERVSKRMFTKISEEEREKEEKEREELELKRPIVDRFLEMDVYPGMKLKHKIMYDEIVSKYPIEQVKKILKKEVNRIKNEL